jgi:hypothetical protein
MELCLHSSCTFIACIGTSLPSHILIIFRQTHIHTHTHAHTHTYIYIYIYIYIYTNDLWTKVANTCWADQVTSRLLRNLRFTSVFTSYCRPSEGTSHPHKLLNIHFNIILPHMSWSLFMRSLPFRFSDSNFMCLLHIPLHDKVAQKNEIENSALV